MKVENIAYTCTTKFSMSGNSLKPILHWIHSDLSEVDYTHQSFETGSNQIAAVLKNLGIQPGEVVSIFLPRSPDLINAFFAILKNKAISCILFSTLGEEALFDRLENCKAKIIITRKSLLKKIMAIKEKLPDLQTILLIDIEEHQSVNVLSLKKLMTGTKGVFTYAHFVDSETPAFLQYTSGSTGKPKGALHVHGALADMLHSFDEIMQPQPGNVYWCTADPAWITGLVYGIIVPFCTGITQIQFDGTYKAESWMKILEDQHVSIWYTAPTALRMLMQEDIHFDAFNFSSLKRIYSVGEPLNPEIYFWGRRTFNKEIYDTWFQSETGCIMVANRPGRNIKPGSMGIPRTGVEILICDDHMQKLPDGTQGHLCVRKGWGSMFRTYYRKEAAYNEKFNGDIYVTGDLAWKDEDGFIWYVSRSDDVINTAGHLVGPFEVESALLEIEDIVDVAVIGVADNILHQKIVAYVTLRKGVEWSRALELKCRVHVSNSVSTSAIPAEFHVIERVPKNQSGKILRRVLKAIYEGKDPGDISTME